jgi:hypothetical protein
MADEKLVQELKAAAEDALARGFAILICEPKDKLPWSKYSLHGVKDATRVPEEALKPWNEGQEANYGIAGEQSNLCVVDCDKGLSSPEQLFDWMKKNGLPDTFIVQSGRAGFGAHIYYSGAMPSVKFDLDGVLGEIKSIGGYVIGAGCIHPDTKEKYKIICDNDIAPTPDILLSLKKTKFEAVIAGEIEIIPASHRNNRLTQLAGQLRNLHLGEDAIFTSLRDFAINRCEDGEAYFAKEENKLKDMAHRAANNWDEQPMSPIVTIGTADPICDIKIPDLPDEINSGDYIGDLAIALTKGTAIPMGFVRANLKTIIGAILDTKIGIPGEDNIHMRHWTGVISRPGSGKSESWKRIKLMLRTKQKTLLESYEVVQPPSGFFSSGEHAIKVLAEKDGSAQLAYFDEMKGLFEKGGNAGSTLFDRLLELYDDTSGSAGSLTHGQVVFSNVRLSMTGNFTPSSYERATAGKNVGGSGFLSRMVMEYSNGIDRTTDWDSYEPALVNSAVSGICTTLQNVYNEFAILQEANAKLPEEERKMFPVVLPTETDGAKKLRLTFLSWLVDEQKRLEKDDPGTSLTLRLNAHFKRDLLFRVFFQPGAREITEDMVQKSITWAKHQLFLRTTLWPVDKGNEVVQCEQRILHAIRTQGPLTKAGLIKWSNAEKNIGGFDAWNRAFKNVTNAGEVILLSVKSDRGKEKFGLDNLTWNRAQQKWVTIA